MRSKIKYLRSLGDNLILTKDNTTGDLQRKLTSIVYSMNDIKPTIAWPDAEVSDSPLVYGHAYTVLGTYENDQGETFVILRNPFETMKDSDNIVTGDEILRKKWWKPDARIDSDVFFALTVTSFRKYFESYGKVK